MAKTLFENRDQAVSELKRIMRRIRMSNRMFKYPRWNVDWVETMGPALVKHMVDAMEALTYLYCCKMADPEGTMPFLKLKDLYKKGGEIGVPLNVRLASRGMLDIKRKAMNDTLKPFDLHDFLTMAQEFLGWAMGQLESPDELFNRLCRDLMHDIEWELERYDAYPQYKKERREGDDRLPPYAMRMLYLSAEDEARMTDEELDEYYKPKKANSQKSLAPLCIYKILQKYTNDEVHFTQQDIIDHLQSDYEIVMDRKAVGRTLNSMSDTFPEVMTSHGNGTWYSEQHVGEWD